MSTPKPLPVPDQDSEGFWAATGEVRLVVQRCRSCQHCQLYPRLYCRRCHGDNLELTEVTGVGEVYTHTVVRRAGSPAFADDVPYSIALIRLAEGPLMMANVIGGDDGALRVGAKVQVDFGDRRGEVAVVRFRPLEAR